MVTPKRLLEILFDCQFIYSSNEALFYCYDKHHKCSTVKCGQNLVLPPACNSELAVHLVVLSNQNEIVRISTYFFYRMLDVYRMKCDVLSFNLSTITYLVR